MRECFYSEVRKRWRNAFLIGNVESQNQQVSITIWDSAQDAEAYDRGPLF